MNMPFEPPQIVNHPPQIFGASHAEGSPAPSATPGPIFTDEQLSGNMDESNDAKRRRIARVCWPNPADWDTCSWWEWESLRVLFGDTGLRHVSQKEDQMRWQDAKVLALPQLQNGMHLYPGREEAESAQGVRHPIPPTPRYHPLLTLCAVE
jgi:hypothetical protein